MENDTFFCWCITIFVVSALALRHNVFSVKTTAAHRTQYIFFATPKRRGKNQQNNKIRATRSFSVPLCLFLDFPFSGDSSQASQQQRSRYSTDTRAHECSETDTVFLLDAGDLIHMCIHTGCRVATNAHTLVHTHTHRHERVIRRSDEKAEISLCSVRMPSVFLRLPRFRLLHVRLIYKIHPFSD